MIRRGLASVRRTGLDRALAGLVIHVRFATQQGDAAASYDRYGGGQVTLNPWSLYDADAGSLIHEIGHRFYYEYMAPKAREAWEAALRERQSSVSMDDLAWARPYVEAYFRDVASDPALRDADGGQRRAVAAQWAAQQPDLSPIETARLRFIVRLAADAKDADKGLESAGSYIREGDKYRGVGIEPTAEPERSTDYGSWNPSEAFAESFRLYVLKPRVLGPWTRQFFRDVVRAGGATRLRYNPASLLGGGKCRPFPPKL